MDDLSERLLEAYANVTAAPNKQYEHCKAMALEIRRHRAAQRADSERVKAMVERIAAHVLGPNHLTLGWADAASAIAARVAEQLASAATVLSEEARECIEAYRRELRSRPQSPGAGYDYTEREMYRQHVASEIAKCDRLLGATC